MMGRSSNTTAFPFFNLESPGIGGVIIAIGWSGQWISLIQRKGDSLSLQTGLDDVHLRLHPGEQIRIPRILFFPWKSADFIDGHNQFPAIYVTLLHATSRWIAHSITFIVFWL